MAKKAAKKAAKVQKPAKKAAKPAKGAPAKSAKPAVKAAAVKAKPAKAVKAKAAPQPPKAKAAPPAKAAVAAKGKAAQPAKPMPPVKEEKKGKAAKSAKQELAAPVAEELEPIEAEVVLTNAEGQRYCKNGECDELSTTDGYCRFHYLLNWKKIQLRKKILVDGKLDRYIEELTARYPDKFLEIIRKDLTTEKEFLAAIQEMEIDESGDNEEFEDDSRTFIDEVRGVTTTTAGEDTDSDF